MQAPTGRAIIEETLVRARTYRSAGMGPEALEAYLNTKAVSAVGI